MDDIPKVFEALFECTFHMISKDGEEYPEHRRNFYKMLQATTVHCFPGQPITVCNQMLCNSYSLVCATLGNMFPIVVFLCMYKP